MKNINLIFNMKNFEKLKQDEMTIQIQNNEIFRNSLKNLVEI